MDDAQGTSCSATGRGKVGEARCGCRLRRLVGCNWLRTPAKMRRNRMSFDRQRLVFYKIGDKANNKYLAGMARTKRRLDVGSVSVVYCSDQDKPFHTTWFHDIDRWQRHINQCCPRLEMAPAANARFHAAIRRFLLGDCALLRIDSSRSFVERTSMCARRSEAGYLKVIWQLQGHMTLSQDQRTVELGAGDASVCDTTRPYRMALGNDARLAVLLIPYHVDARLSQHAGYVSATRLTESASMQAALGALMALVNTRPTPVIQEAEDVVHCVITLLAGVFGRMHAHADDTRDVRRLRQAHCFIESHMASNELTPDRLAEALNVSRRSLYALCARHGTTPARLIVDVRLWRAREALACTRPGRSITDIALAHGFSDGARFSHAFKARFGQAPSHWRRQLTDV